MKIEYSDKKTFKKFLSEACKEWTLTKEGKEALINTIVKTFSENPHWIEDFEEMISLWGYCSEVMLKAISQLIRCGWKDFAKIYKIVSRRIISTLYEYNWTLSTEIKEAIDDLKESISTRLFSQMSLNERILFYEQIGGYFIDDDVFKGIYEDCYSLKSWKQKKILIEKILSYKYSKTAPISVQKSIYLDVLADIVIYSITEDIFFPYRLDDLIHFHVFPLIGTIPKEDFKILCEIISSKLSIYKFRFFADTKLAKFLAYAVGIKEDFYITAESVELFVKYAAPLIPYLTREKFWNLVSQVESYINCLPYMLNNDCITENKAFMLKALEVYLNSDDDTKLKNHKLLIDVDVVGNLSPKQASVLAVRSIDGNNSVRFIFTMQAYTLIRTKIIAGFISGTSCISKREYERFISLCKTVNESPNDDLQNSYNL